MVSMTFWQLAVKGSLVKFRSSMRNLATLIIGHCELHTLANDYRGVRNGQSDLTPAARSKTMNNNTY